METFSSITSAQTLSPVLILPMRNGNFFHLQYYFLIRKRVLILPMRNGNISSNVFYTHSGYCSYPTYEEWKPTILYNISSYLLVFLSYLWGMETSIIAFFTFYVNKFLSYLWGMETFKKSLWSGILIQSSYPTYEEWKLSMFSFFFSISLIVLILPMRNGNIDGEGGLSVFISYVLILPMRNGNIDYLNR